jgi:Protein of unknown function (DUF2844)
MAPPFAALLLAVVLLGAPKTALAALGGDEQTIESDRAQTESSRSVSAHAGYQVHELRSPSGTVIREFASEGGTVFAVAWQGPFIPNLRQLLGPYFESFARASLERPHRGPSHAPLIVRTPDLVVEAGGHMRAFFGRAYLPDQVPASLDDGGIQ